MSEGHTGRRKEDNEMEGAFAGLFAHWWVGVKRFVTALENERVRALCGVRGLMSLWVLICVHFKKKQFNERRARFVAMYTQPCPPLSGSITVSWRTTMTSVPKCLPKALPTAGGAQATLSNEPEVTKPEV